MKLKLTRIQFTAIYKLWEAHYAKVMPKGIEQIMLHGVLLGLYKKFYNNAFDVKLKYSISLTDAEACAFYFYFSRIDLSGLTYEQNLIQTINNQIDQLYA